mmetsp:Transcript_3648/g.10760  ORF Transcript_3648/g.10760 Transcript_3648/m.10760 type:complete len:235 (+) Transcript_3648:1359-2063(+)
MGVAGRGAHLEDARVDGQKRHVEGAAAEVEDEDVLLALLLVHAVRDGRGRRLVDDALHGHAGDGARVLGRLALRVVEVGRHGDDRVLDLGAEEGLGRGAHLREHHGGDLLGREGLGAVLELDADVRLVVLGHELEGEELLVGLDALLVELAADEALDVEDGVDGVDRGLVLGGVADEALRLVERDVGRRRAVALVVSDDLHAIILPHAHAGVGRTEVDADGLAGHVGHGLRLLL